MAVALDDIQTELADLDIEVTDEAVLGQLAQLCQRYGIDAEKISCEYFSFANNTKATIKGKLIRGSPTLETLAPFENEKLKSLKPAGQRRPLDPIEGPNNLPDCPEISTPERNGSSKHHLTPENHLMAKRLVTAQGTPGMLSSSLPSSPVVVGKKYSERTNSGEVVVKHGVEDGWGVACRAAVKMPSGCLDKPYKFMYERLRDRAVVLDDAITKVGSRLVGEDDREMLDLTSTHPDLGLAIGRVQCDGEGRLNSNSVVLHGGLETCGGAAVPVDLSQVPSFSLFPGQIVAMDATNPNGSRLVAHKIHPGKSCGPVEEVSELEQGTTLSVLTACGPFSTSDSSSLEPLDDLLNVVKKENPSVVILIGPFLDIRNPLIAEANLTFEAQWVKVLETIGKATEDLEIEVVLVTSLRDVHSLPIYPQPPFPVVDSATASLLKSFPNIKYVSDPSTISVSGVNIGITSSDILFHLGKEEISFPPRSGDRMARLASHLLTQGSFYPLYPPSEEMSVDYEQLESKATMHRAPHLLLLPSDLSHFVREVENCIVVNPGRVTRGQGPGTYARLKMRKDKDGLVSSVEVARI